ncbi:RNA polymerase sigma factor [Promicromonospora sp. NPDC052451]|uniref:RNA polymerase sigma factor n=1 Tax=Promicromonospora sp. NPDC052451 TaxID=3364407 RepID=UPI0037C993BF
MLWNEHAGRVLAYASRHVDAHEAQEIVAETFLVAWRRIQEVPDPPLPWLLVVARNTISNHVRTTVRRRRTESEFEKLERLVMPREGVDVTTEERDAVLRGLRGVSDDDREVLLLTGWDGLTPAEAAQVLGCSATTYRARLSRARKRFERAAQADGQSDSATGFFRRTR